MKIRPMSDLHLHYESGWERFQLSRVDADVIVLAGNIEFGNRGLLWAQKTFAETPVIYVLGNHEHYFHAVPELANQLREEALGTNIHVLENDAIVIDGVRFLGCTLWTDYQILGQEFVEEGREWSADAARKYWIEATSHASQKFNDYKLIKYRGFEGDDGYEYHFQPYDACELHKDSKQWLAGQLQDDTYPTVVVTHHLPSIRSLPEDKRRSLDAPFYASALDELVASSGAALWIHGHQRHAVQYEIGETTVYCNPRGSDHSKNAPQNGFCESAVLEI